ncbi:MAG: hypothetical protein KDB79_12885 [Acidobacteria bacterium]|nr:hypothetical protein [Acidobacteriota bacterium]
MSNKIQNRSKTALKEKSQYGLTFGVIAMMLFVAGFPMVVIFFFGIFAYFLWKTFSPAPQNGVRQIFEFYLSASAILREDERQWFGFEVQEVIAKGERILHVMHGAPPLVYFALGALYNKIGSHENAVKHLSYVVEDEHSNESSYLHPSSELRNYVKVLRKLEMDPSEGPQTTAAVRSLERARKNRGKILLEESRGRVLEGNLEPKHISNSDEAARDHRGSSSKERSLLQTVTDTRVPEAERHAAPVEEKNSVRRKPSWRDLKKTVKRDDDMFADRKPITEVLHDIYDKNIQ